jgi:hypothetical protein
MNNTDPDRSALPCGDEPNSNASNGAPILTGASPQDSAQQKIEKAESLLAGTIPVLWKNGDAILWSELKRLSAFDTVRSARLFEAAEKNEKGSKYKGRKRVQFIVKGCACKRCSPHDESASRSDIVKLLTGIRKNDSFVCPSCEKRIEVEEKAALDREDHKYRLSDRERCERFVSWLLSEFDSKYPQLVSIYDIQSAFDYFNTDHKMIGAIKGMPYRAFLRTNYWKSIASEIKKKAGKRCQMCNRGGEVHTHHRTYRNHGKEHNYPEDLVCVCDECHSKFHGKESRPS